VLAVLAACVQSSIHCLLMTSSVDLRFRHKGSKAAPVVLDIGSALTRAGIAGEEQPRHIIHTPASLSLNPSSPPVSASVWRSRLSPYLRHLLFSLLLLNPPDRRVVVIEQPLAPTAFRTAIVAALYDLLCPALLLLPSGPLPLLLSASSSPSGLTVDVGWEESRVIATYAGVVLMEGETLQLMPIGMRAVVQRLREETMQDERNAHVRDRLQAETGDREWADVLARVGWVRGEEEKDDGNGVRCPVRRLPPSYLEFDSTAFLPSSVSSASLLSSSSSSSYASSPPLTITVPAATASSAASVLFGANPEGFSLPDLVASVLSSLPVELRSVLAANIRLCGGGSHLPGIHARLLSAMQSKLPAGLAHRVRVLGAGWSGSEGGGAQSAWCGGSVIASVLMDAEDEWIGREEMRLYFEGREQQPRGRGKPEGEKEEEKEEDEAQPAVRHRKREAVELEDWLWPLGARPTLTVKQELPSLSASLLARRSLQSSAEATAAAAAAAAVAAASVSEPATEEDTEQY
jgi:hypothetical protein